MALADGCHQLRYLNLTWCIRVSDRGVEQLASSCIGLRWLSLHGILGITDRCIRSLAATCASSLNTLDVNGCRNASLTRSPGQLEQLFPHVLCWHVHS